MNPVDNAPHHTVVFDDHRRDPKCKPDPRWPEGKDVDASGGSAITCTVAIPYPAPRCGLMVVTCSRCHLEVALTVAGRVDDPRSVRLACNLVAGAAPPH